MRIEVQRRSGETLQKDIFTYLGIMIIGLVISSLFFDSDSTIFWAVNLFGLFVFLKYIKFIQRNMGIMVIIYIVLTGILPILTHIEYVDFTIKGIGTSAGVIIAPLYVCFFSNLKYHTSLSKNGLLKILHFVSVLGTVLFIFSLVMGAQDYIRVLTGSLGAYSAKTSGILDNKNLYGEILALSTCCDLFIQKIQKSKQSNFKRWGLFIIKSIGVVFSFSRAALLQLAISIFVFIWLEKKRTVREWILLAIAMVCLLYGYTKYEAFRQIILNQIIRVDAGDAGRSMLRTNALSQAVNNIWSVFFGVSYFGVEKLGIDIDNSYYHTFFTGGIIKCVFYCYWALYSFRCIFWLKTNSSLLGNMCLAIAISYYIYAVFESVPLLELGMLNFLFMIFMYIIPNAYKEGDAV